jgi:hypothetical protein
MSEANMSIVAPSWQGLGDNPDDNHVYKIPVEQLAIPTVSGLG